MPSTILLGHSLESDLRALQLAHPRCIDTALLFHHPRGRPLKPGLAWLTRKWLGRTIQDRGPGGHNPEEDAQACVDLLKAKIKNGAPPLPRDSRTGRLMILRYQGRGTASSGRIMSRSLRASRAPCTVQTDPPRVRRSSTTAIPALGTALRQPRLPPPSHVQTTRRCSTDCLAFWIRTTLCLRGSWGWRMP